MDTKNRIIEKADELFHLYGIRSVTMDDIAKALGISKKTIYQFFADKDDIVTQVSVYHLDQEQHEFEAIFEKSENAIRELYDVSICLRKNISSVNPSILYDLQKYHNKGWSIFLEYKENVFKQGVLKTLKRGVSEGYFRSEIDPEVLATVRMEQIQMSFDQHIFPSSKYDFRQVQAQLFEHFIYGIMTEPGRNLYEETIRNASKNQTQYEK